MYRDRIQKHTYPRGNTATLLNYLEELVLINAKEVGLVPIGEEDGGFQDILLLFNQVISLTVPDEAVSATIMVEADLNPVVFNRTEEQNRSLNSDPNIVVRFKENGGAPTRISGFGLGNNDIFELVGMANLKQFKVVAIQPFKRPILRIQYYKTAQNK